MNKFNVINFHITDRCNYACKYCFGKFNKRELSLEKAKMVIDSIDRYFKHRGIKNGRINFAGGEPLLYPNLDEIIDYCAEKHINVSIVTNGSLLTPERIYKWQGKVCQIGISIDSNNDTVNAYIGRHACGKVLKEEQLIRTVKAIKECKIELKINTVASRININEDLSQLYLMLMPDKIKLFQMHIVDGVNDKSRFYSISQEEFHRYCEKYAQLPFNIVREKQGDMENSYLMIDPDGTLIVNDRGSYKSIGSVLETELYNATLPLSYSKFMLRYKRGHR